MFTCAVCHKEFPRYKARYLMTDGYILNPRDPNMVGLTLCPRHMAKVASFRPDAHLDIYGNRIPFTFEPFVERDWTTWRGE